MNEAESALRVALVGPCAAGKSTLKEALVAEGYEVRHVAQEHSHVPTMWQRVSRPDVLIFLDVDYDAVRKRRPYDTGGPERVAEQQRRLAHARAHADLYLDTSTMSPEAVQARALAFLRSLPVDTASTTPE